MAGHVLGQDDRRLGDNLHLRGRDGDTIYMFVLYWLVC